MRIICLLALLCTVGCSPSDAPKETGTTTQQEPSVTPKEASTTQQRESAVRTSDNLVHLEAIPAVSEGYHHPLVCGPGGDLPVGEELIFRNAESKEFVHAVFPGKVTAPDELKGNFVLHGRFQGIQDRTRYTMIQPAEDYRYFVVASWDRKEQ